jgi:phosphatidylglycerol:prolipoprotein diacylglycerol transferase
MFPFIIRIGSFTLHSYGLMAAIGFLLAVWVINRHKDYAKLNSDQTTTLLMSAMISGIIGARIFYVVQFYNKEFAGNFWRIFRIDQGGLVFYGGFILAVLVLIGYCKWQKLDFMRVLDIFTPGMALAHACGRVGCFLHGCCYGKITTVPWGVTYPANSYPAQMTGNAALHPVQLYEAGEMVVLFFIFSWVLKFNKRGVPFSLYLIVYGVLRFFNELFRGDNPHLLNLFTPAQCIGLLLIPLGVIMLIYFLKYERQTTDIQH